MLQKITAPGLMEAIGGALIVAAAAVAFGIAAALATAGVALVVKAGSVDVGRRRTSIQ